MAGVWVGREPALAYRESLKGSASLPVAAGNGVIDDGRAVGSEQGCLEPNT